MRSLKATAIDVLFDLNGYSGGEAIRIFAQRPAPLQVNFLGYTGTLGSSALRSHRRGRLLHSAREHETAYTERVLPDRSVLPSLGSTARPVASPDAGTRGLRPFPPTQSCSARFGAVYKIVPEMFELRGWLSLRDVPDSVLWLRHIANDRIGASAR